MDNVELKEARARKIPVIPRAEMLAELMRLKYSIAVAGTHGKTSTTSMIATVLTVAGKDPTFVVGGRLKIEDSGAKLGKSEYLIAEADESDGSFLSLLSTIAVITNIEDDHLDYYKSLDNLINAFVDFSNKVPFYGSVIIIRDDDICRAIIPRINKILITFGLGQGCDIRGDKVTSQLFHSRFDLIEKGQNLGTVEMNIGGRHNILNALAAAATCRELGIAFEDIARGLKQFNLPDRRFQVLFQDENYLVVDDYAHHPTEILTTLELLQEGNFSRNIAVFQPHRYTRLQLLLEDFLPVFDQADLLIITRLYAASQKEIKDVNSKVLVEKLKTRGIKEVLLIEDFEDVLAFLDGEVRSGDGVIFLSAGDLTRAAHQFARRLEERKQ
jgi:UDP-N-acetylmuramate--alanine ligase